MMKAEAERSPMWYRSIFAGNFHLPPPPPDPPCCDNPPQFGRLYPNVARGLYCVRQPRELQIPHLTLLDFWQCLAACTAGSCRRFLFAPTVSPLPAPVLLHSPVEFALSPLPVPARLFVPALPAD